MGTFSINTILINTGPGDHSSSADSFHDYLSDKNSQKQKSALALVKRTLELFFFFFVSQEPFDMHVVDATGVMSDSKRRILLDWQEMRVIAPPVCPAPVSRPQLATAGVNLEDEARDLVINVHDLCLLRMARVGPGGQRQVKQSHFLKRV